MEVIDLLLHLQSIGDGANGPAVKTHLLPIIVETGQTAGLPATFPTIRLVLSFAKIAHRYF